MNPIIRMLGRVLRLVGISSPEDSLPKKKAVDDPPSWREALKPPLSPPAGPKAPENLEP